MVALNVLPYMTEAEEATFFARARQLAPYVLVSHANRLFDLVTFNRFTLQFWEANLLQRLSGADQTQARTELRPLLSEPDGPARQTEPHKGSERDLLQKRLVDPFRYCPAGFAVAAFRGVNPHPLPPKLLDAHPDWKRAALDATFDDPTLERLCCSQFQVLLRSI